MTPTAQILRDVLAEDGYAQLTEIGRGIEKEGLRVNPATGMLAQTPHPRALGSALTHPSITTDYSESLLEFITPVSTRIDTSLDQLGAIHRFTASKLDNELVWGASMPCIVAGESGIPIASYGSSNVGTMKRVYRNGLGARYGRMMQAIAGIHYNFSLPDSFWEASWTAHGHPESLQQFKTEGYLGLIRNFFNRVWLLIYLTGASPAVCASFLAGNKNHHLQPFDPGGNTLHLPHATSLRMGDLGYNSNAQAGLDVCYNKLDNYIRLLHRAIVEPHPAYRDFGLTDDGERAQLSDSLLQIENEYYSPIRPKRVTLSGEAPLVALQRAGIEYIEVRCVDINPFMPLGIDAETVRLLDIFLLDCLLSDSPPCDDATRQRDKENLRRVVNDGRAPDLTLATTEGDRPFREVTRVLLDSMAETAEILDTAHGTKDYAAALVKARAKVEQTEEVPSGRILREMGEQAIPFWQLALNYSRQWQQQFLDEPLSANSMEAFEATATQSLEQQALLEADETEDFDSYLRNFFDQYRKVKI